MQNAYLVLSRKLHFLLTKTVFVLKINLLDNLHKLTLYHCKYLFFKSRFYFRLCLGIVLS